MIDRIGSRYGVRPSDILGIDDELVAFQFDYAIIHFANQIEKGFYRDKRIMKKKQEEGISKLRLMKSQADMIKRKRYG